MALWIKFKGILSDDMGVIVQILPSIPRPERNATHIVIPGRDGHLTISDDTYASVEMPIMCAVKTLGRINEISDWLSGSGDLILSSEPDKRYKAEVFSPFGYDRLSRRIREFEVVFTAQPFRYEATPQTISLTQSGVIVNPGTRWSKPVIDVYGAGVLTVADSKNTYTLTVQATPGEDHVTIDSEIEECYYNTELRNNKVSGVFPKLQPGNITVTLGSGITRVDITGNWRWI